MRKFNTVQSRLMIYSCIFFFLYISFFLYATATDISSEYKNPSPFGVDFAVYYTAGQMVKSGDVDNIYDVPEHHAELEEVLNRKIPFLLSWVYPPTFLLAIVPFSFLPYHLALILWLIITFALAAYAAYLIVPKHKNIAFLICGFPGVLMNLRWGQNGFLNTALLGFGIYFIERNPVLSGLTFGLLTYKPQMAFFPLILLLISKKWKVLAWTIFFAVLSAMVSSLIFGLETWVKFLNSFSNSTTALLESNWEGLSGIQPSFYTTFRLAGINNANSYILLGSIGVIVTIVSWWIWKNTERLSLKGSVLVLGILITMPYFIQYDLIILSIPLILLSYDCLEYGYKLSEIVLLYILWIMPLVNWPLVMLTKVQISPFVLIAVLVMIVIRVTNAKIDNNKNIININLDK